MKKSKKRKPVVNIDKRVSKTIKQKKISKVSRPPKSDYSKKEVKAFIKEKTKGRERVVTEKQFEKMSDKQRDKAIPFSEAERQYIEARTNWFFRYKPYAEYEKKIVVTRRNKKTGEVTEYAKTVTLKRYRDTKTGRFVAASSSKFVYDYRTKAYRRVAVPGKVSVASERYKMRKEAAILKIAEKKKISIEDARKVFASFEERGMERYIMKEYAETPK